MSAKPNRSPRWATRRAAVAAIALGMVHPGRVRAATQAGEHVHVVRMVADAKGFRFEPEHLAIGRGDTLVFEVASGQPHDVAFDTTGLNESTVRQLSMRLHDQIAPLAGPLLVKPGERYIVNFDGMPAGRYPFYCLPHQAVQMKGWVLVQ